MPGNPLVDGGEFLLLICRLDIMFGCCCICYISPEHYRYLSAFCSEWLLGVWRYGAVGCPILDAACLGGIELCPGC